MTGTMTQRWTSCRDQAGDPNGVTFGKPYASLVLQIAVLSVIHFWVGVAIGMGLNELQKLMTVYEDAEKKKIKRDNGALWAQVTFIMLLASLCFLFAQTFLGYIYQLLYCIATQSNTPGRGDNQNAHKGHGGFAMFFGIAWTSGATMEKLHILLNPSLN